MCDPLVAVLSTAFSVGQQLSAASTARSEAAFNAQVAAQNAAIASQEGALAQGEARRALRGRLGAQRASFGARGLVREGSPLDVLGQTARDGELDVRKIGFESALRERQSLNRAAQARASGGAATARAFFGVGSSLLSGATAFGNAGLDLGGSKKIKKQA